MAKLNDVKASDRLAVAWVGAVKDKSNNGEAGKGVAATAQTQTKAMAALRMDPIHTNFMKTCEAVTALASIGLISADNDTVPQRSFQGKHRACARLGLLPLQPW